MKKTFNDISCPPDTLSVSKSINLDYVKIEIFDHEIDGGFDFYCDKLTAYKIAEQIKAIANELKP